MIGQDKLQENKQKNVLNIKYDMKSMFSPQESYFLEAGWATAYLHAASEVQGPSRTPQQQAAPALGTSTGSAEQHHPGTAQEGSWGLGWA